MAMQILLNYVRMHSWNVSRIEFTAKFSTITRNNAPYKLTI